MKILVVGGTAFVGRLIVEATLARGHDVTLLHRGLTGASLFPESEHLLADRDGDLGVLDGREFDATIDVSAYFPRQVRSIAAALGGGGGRYVLISTCSVYAVPDAPGFDESAELLPEADEAETECTELTYGPLKVTAERVAQELFAERVTIVRPTYVIGPWDHTRRFTAWVERIAQGGEVLAPGDPTDSIQLIDGRDMASWIVGLVEADVSGSFHAVSPSSMYTFADMLSDIAAAVAPHGTTFTWVESSWLAARGVGPESLPLWDPNDPFAAANTADPSKANLSGLAPRSIQQSAREIVEHVREVPPEGASPMYSREREHELLALWSARS